MSLDDSTIMFSLCVTHFVQNRIKFSTLFLIRIRQNKGSNWDSILSNVFILEVIMNRDKNKTFIVFYAKGSEITFK